MEDMELEEMRNQIAILKDKLERQEIVSDKLIRRSMKSKVTVVRIQAIASIVGAVFCLIAFPILKMAEDYSWWFIGATEVMMVYVIVVTYRYYHPLLKQDLMTADLKTVATQVSTLKRKCQWWLHVVTPTVCIPWLAWYCYENVKASNMTGHEAYILCGSILVGAGIGAFVGYLMHRKMVNVFDEILEQLKPEEGTSNG